MEKDLEHVANEILKGPGVYGCLFSDQRGLCLTAKGKASTESAGIVEAIANLAGELEPKSKPPVIVFENDQRSCTIQHYGAITAAIYKTLD